MLSAFFSSVLIFDTIPFLEETLHLLAGPFAFLHLSFEQRPGSINASKFDFLIQIHKEIRNANQQALELQWRSKPARQVMRQFQTWNKSLKNKRA
jgi:hypothetical protein